MMVEAVEVVEEEADAAMEREVGLGSESLSVLVYLVLFIPRACSFYVARCENII